MAEIRTRLSRAQIKERKDEIIKYLRDRVATDGEVTEHFNYNRGWPKRSTAQLIHRLKRDDRLGAFYDHGNKHIYLYVPRLSDTPHVAVSYGGLDVISNVERIVLLRDCAEYSDEESQLEWGVLNLTFKDKEKYYLTNSQPNGKTPPSHDLYGIKRIGFMRPYPSLNLWLDMEMHGSLIVRRVNG